jgi:hypothetical protein
MRRQGSAATLARSGGLFAAVHSVLHVFLPLLVHSARARERPASWASEMMLYLCYGHGRRHGYGEYPASSSASRYESVVILIGSSLVELVK